LLRCALRCGLVCALLSLGSNSASALTLDEARHLLARTSFAPTVRDVEVLRPLDRAAAVNRLIAETRRIPESDPPGWTEDWHPPQRQDLSDGERRALREEIIEQAVELKRWWMLEMVTTSSPFTEFMTLFWHNHFTSGLGEVKAPALLYRQNLLLRRHALGNFRDLLHAVARDPAMLLYLDNARSRAEAPNENFARELLELFTLGEGRYSEEDIKNIARAFTGWSLNPETGRFVFRKRWHDNGEKVVLGRSGRFDGDDVLEILLAHSRTAEFVAEKIWRAFVSETPDPDAIPRLARIFRDSDYEIKPLIAAVLLEDAFWKPGNRGRLVKSPVELLVGTVRLFNLPVRDGRILVWASRRLGQDLFQPPNVKGWPGDAEWITADSSIARQEFVSRASGQNMIPVNAPDELAVPNEKQSRRLKVAKRRAALFDRWVEALPPDYQDSNALEGLVLALPPVDVETLDRRGSGALLRHFIADPVYQLK